MADYTFRQIEKKWQAYWREQKTFKVTEDTSRPKYYALDMFPYPSGAGLHVGHPLGYIASDIVARYKRIKGFNVLHPMGFDSFGLPAEQYAIQTGQHPAITTEQNINRYKEQLANLGFSYDWDREVRTSDPAYYKWTQWIFMELFRSWYNQETDRAEPIETLVERFAQEGNRRVQAVCDEDTPSFSAEEWRQMDEREQQFMLLRYRLTYLSDAVVNWCPALGTVLANDEVKDGLSERGGYPVERKLMRQWMMRISAYAERLLQGLDTIDWPEPLKEMQRYWIGKSIGAELEFALENSGEKIKVFTTRLDTIYGVSFLVLAPEHELVEQITTEEQRAEVKAYVAVAKNRSERERMADVKTVSGVFTGAYALNPFNGEKVPVYIADYVLAGYGTGAVMAVPSGDQRDWNFATHFHLPILPILDTQQDLDQQADPTKEGRYINSGIIDGLTYQEALPVLVDFLEKQEVGKSRINYRMRDAVFSRQRYWGEPVPVYFEDGIPRLLEEEDLPLELPVIDEYKPTETGEAPLGRAKDWKYKGEYPYELNTMPGWAGSSWYFYRYMDAHNDQAFASPETINYWRDVDLYIGGSEHATGHLLYSRFWNKFLFDRGYVPEEEPFKKLINQGMIQGRSNFVYRINGTNTYVSHGLREQHEVTPLHVDVNIVENDVLDLEAFKAWRPELANAEFILEDGKYICGVEIEKMSKSKYNVVNPDDLVERAGADTLRLYEMFLGPLEQFKPWNTHGMDGVLKFLRKYWKLFFAADGSFAVSEEAPTAKELKALHKTIKKVEEDIERFSFNTSVSTFMICVNELTALKTNKRAILEPLTIILSPYAPHITEELWEKLGHQESISTATYPAWNEAYLAEDTFEYPISINGKMRTKMSFAADAPKEDIEKAVMAAEQVQKYLEGKQPKKIIVVPNKIVNVVV
jgi:leucyl-tRNA synthetase